MLKILAVSQPKLTSNLFDKFMGAKWQNSAVFLKIKGILGKIQDNVRDRIFCFS